ncbi:MAG: alginate lyase family protein [bacterium]
MTAVGDWRLKAILRRFEKLKGRSMSELRERTAQALASELEYRGLATTIGEPTDQAQWSLLDASRIPGEGNTATRLHDHFTHRVVPSFFAGVRDGSSARELQSPRWSSHLSQLIATADRILSGQFDLLGHRDLSFGSPIDWHLDPVAGKRAPRVHWSRIPYLNAEIIGDHKVIWELNRHQHLMILGRAYQATGRADYAACFVAQLSSWMDANPPKDGVNWASSLEVAYRAIAWLWAMELFRGAPELTPAVLQRQLKFFYSHGRHLERYLSTYFSPNTHLTGEALGLLYLGTMLPEFKRAARWRALGWEILERELIRHVHTDGVYFEQSTYYHRYTVDIYLHALMMAEGGGMTVPAAMRDRLGLAAAALADFTRPDGTIPIIGDDDGGRLVALEDRDCLDVRSTLSAVAVVLDLPELAAAGGEAGEELLWLLGPDGVRRYDGYRGREPGHGSRLFREGGYAIMRDGWGPLTKHATIDCGPFGAMNCGHAHSDLLSIEVSVAGCAIIVDPGTYTYTGSAFERDRFRHSAAHNTVSVDGESAAVPSGPFSWAQRTNGVVENWWAGALTDRLVGSHGGFSRLPDPVTHRRSVLFVRGDYWIVVDSIVGQGDHESVAHFQLAPGATVASTTSTTAWINAECQGAGSGLFFGVAGDVDALEWGEDWVSRAYGVRTRAPHGRVIARGSGRRDLITALIPAAAGMAVSVVEVPVNQGRAVVVNRPDIRDLVLLRTADTGLVRLDSVEMHADAAFVRYATDGSVSAVALYGTDATISLDGMMVHGSGAVEAVRRVDGWAITGDGRVDVGA